MGRGQRWLAWALTGSLLIQGMLPAPATAGSFLERIFATATDKVLHTRPPLPPATDPVLDLAREVTRLEDDLRRDGTITIKQPDVWGDANLMQFIQEYEREMAAQGKADKFQAVLSSLIARSDVMEFQSATALGIASGKRGDTVIAPPNVAVPGVTTTGTPDSDSAKAVLIDIPGTGDNDSGLFGLITSSIEGKSGDSQKNVDLKVGVEPTELLRQQSTYLAINHALRRKNMGDDNSRLPGYGLYLFRVPVSVLPGRETFRGHSAVVTLRAQLAIEPTHLKNTFPRLMTADAVDQLTVLVRDHWNRPEPTEAELQAALLASALSELEAQVACAELSAESRELLQQSVLAARRGGAATDVTHTFIAIFSKLGNEKKELEAKQTSPPNVGLDQRIRAIDVELEKLDRLRKSFLDAVAPPGDPTDRTKITTRSSPNLPSLYGPAYGDSLRQLIGFARKEFETRTGVAASKVAVPQHAELRDFLFAYFSSLNTFLEQNQHYAMSPQGPLLLAELGPKLIAGGIVNPKAICAEPAVEKLRVAWINGVKACCTPGTLPTAPLAHPHAEISWILAVHAALLDQDLKRILRDLAANHRLCPEDAGLIDAVAFFAPDQMPAEANRLWEQLIQQTFPLYVFTLDPQVEEQNIWDAFSMRREMQLALAIGVARGNINLAQRVALSRQLGLDQAGIDLNRTAVAFAHGADTFGWYFHPRVQAPPPEENNLCALYRLVCQGGPGRTYDLNHRELEPGIRECEVLLVMPGFVPGVRFDVTTNWERLVRPGETKRTYEQMLMQGRQLVCARKQAQQSGDTGCYRPGDWARLMSRVDQLEQMLGMQTYETRIPYEYELAGRDLFDLGDKELRPVAHDFYGLDFLAADANSKTHEAYFFVTGKNFHPTQTHVIVGGVEAHSVGPIAAAPPAPAEGTGGPAKSNGQGSAASVTTDVEVISRELIRVRIAGLDESLSRKNAGSPAFTVRIATPAGISNPLTIESSPSSPSSAPAAPQPAPAATPAATHGLRWKNEGPFCAEATCEGGRLMLRGSSLSDLIIADTTTPAPLFFEHHGLADIVLHFAAADAAGNPIVLADSAYHQAAVVESRGAELRIRDANLALRQIIGSITCCNKVAKLTVTGYVHPVSGGPYVKTLNALTIQVIAPNTPCAAPAAGTGAGPTSPAPAAPSSTPTGGAGTSTGGTRQVPPSGAMPPPTPGPTLAPSEPLPAPPMPPPPTGAGQPDPVFVPRLGAGLELLPPVDDREPARFTWQAGRLVPLGAGPEGVVPVGGLLDSFSPR